MKARRTQGTQQCCPFHGLRVAPQVQVCRATVELVADEQGQADGLSLRGLGLSLRGVGLAVEAAQGAVRIDLGAQAGLAVQVQVIGGSFGHEADILESAVQRVRVSCLKRRSYRPAWPNAKDSVSAA